MKTKKFGKKLVLNKETIVTLDSVKMAMPKGGAHWTYPKTVCSCPTICPLCLETEGPTCP